MLNVDATNIDIIIGSLAGCVSGAGGFCTGASLMVEHQRLNSPAVTFSASLPTFLTTTASEVITRLQCAPGAELLGSLQDRTAALRHQLAQSDWVRCTSAPQNPVIMLVLKEEHVLARSLSRSQQETLLQECVDEVSCNSREKMDAEIGLTIIRRPCPVTTFLSHALRPCRSWKV
jgi:serine palmitoyltransferase